MYLLKVVLSWQLYFQVDENPELPSLIQTCINEGVRQKDLPETLNRKHGIQISLRSVQKISKECGIVTSRRNGLTSEQQAMAIGSVLEDDPTNQWGSRTVKEKLALRGVHVPRDNIAAYQRALNPAGVEMRNPSSGVGHPHGLWSTGPNEDWCCDGHEKLLRQMGIAVYGFNDKFSRVELGLWAAPSARSIDLPPALFIRLIKKKKGMPLMVTADMGTETGKLISLVNTLRDKCVKLSRESIPAFKSVKSTKNIVRERAWRPIYHKELSNVLYEHNLGLVTSGYQENDALHYDVKFWLWGRIVQLRLDEIIKESEIHKVRKQQDILLPSSARRIDMYEDPTRFNGKDCLIDVPEEWIEELTAQYDRPDLLQFGSDDAVAMCEDAYRAIGEPRLSAKVGWDVFNSMVAYLIDTGYQYYSSLSQYYSN
ncbi:hypothetical protein CPC08DRAFT_648378 [Agrocybe pediades]|nr:hypothetical protein CPC08DRAFT_648378 [Agrocybe pediades]